MHHGGAPTGQWAIQVGAYSNERLAHAAVGTARERAAAELAVARIVGVRRAPGARGAVSRATDRTVARCRGAGLPTAGAWPHEQLHGGVAGVAVVAGRAK